MVTSGFAKRANPLVGLTAGDIDSVHSPQLVGGAWTWMRCYASKSRFGLDVGARGRRSVNDGRVRRVLVVARRAVDAGAEFRLSTARGFRGLTIPCVTVKVGSDLVTIYSEKLPPEGAEKENTRG